MSEQITVRYPITVAMRRASLRASIKTIGPSRKTAAIVGMIIGGVIFGVTSSEIIPGFKGLHLAIFLSGALAFIAFLRIYHHFLNKKIVAAETNSFVGVDGIELVANRDILQVSSGGIQTRIDWRCIERVVDLGDHVGIGWAASTIAVPVEHLPPEVSKTEFIDRIESWRVFG